MNIQSIFNDHIVHVYLKQMKLLDRIGNGGWRYDNTSGIITFSTNLAWKVQTLGLETNTGIWMWSWADEGNLPSDSLRIAGKIRNYGLKHSIVELTTAQLDLYDYGINGHDLAVVASALVKPSPYFICPMGSILLYVLIADKSYPSEIATPTPHELSTLLPKLICDYKIPEPRHSLKSAFKLYEYDIKEEGRILHGTREGHTLSVCFDETGRLTEIACR